MRAIYTSLHLIIYIITSHFFLELREKGILVHPLIIIKSRRLVYFTPPPKDLQLLGQFTSIIFQTKRDEN